MSAGNGQQTCNAPVGVADVCGTTARTYAANRANKGTNPDRIDGSHVTQIDDDPDTLLKKVGDDVAKDYGRRGVKVPGWPAHDGRIRTAFDLNHRRLLCKTQRGPARVVVSLFLCGDSSCVSIVGGPGVMLHQ
jgi:hypothetical protein